MKLLTIGDIVGENGLDTVERVLRPLKRRAGIDFVIANGENIAGRGLLPCHADALLGAGVDVITLGNHALARAQIAPYLDEQAAILRPANWAPQAPGRGFAVYDAPCGLRVLVLNLVGRVDMPAQADNPFLCADRVLKQQAGNFDLAVVECHASATSEKIALGYYLDGRAACVWGTHTHVQTADERIHAGGTGYLTDVGMTGPVRSVLGVCVEQSIAMFRGDLTERFRTASGACALEGAIFTIERGKGCTAVERVREPYGR